MASIHYGKIKGSSQAKAWLRHCDSEERLKHTHRNKDIDTERTAQNINFLNRTYEESCKAYDTRIAELDRSTNTNRRKDRVTLFGLVISMPEGLKQAEEVELMKYAIDAFKGIYGSENVVDAVGHWDEIHDYVSSDTVKTSRAHLHLFVVPEIGGRLCGKEFSSKASMKRMNQMLDKECLRRFGRHFLTGEQPGRKSVEELKQNTSDLEKMWKLNKAVEKKELTRLGDLLKDKSNLRLLHRALNGEREADRERCR